MAHKTKAQRMKIGSLLRSPGFRDLPGLAQGIDALPLAELRKVHLGDGAELPDFRAVTKQGTGDAYAVVSKDYQLVQHREAMQPILEGLRDRGLSFTGSFLPGANGKARAYILLEGDGFRSSIRKDEPLAIGVRVENSLDASASLSLKGFGLNLVCLNGMVLARLLGDVRMRHVSAIKISQGMSAFEGFVESLMDRATKLPGIFERARSHVITVEERKPLLLGIGIAPRDVATIEASWPALLVGQQAEGPLSVEQAFNAVTNHYTHGYERSVVRADAALASAERLLVESPASLISLGRERQEAPVAA